MGTILFAKTSSLGDVHNCPAVATLARRFRARRSTGRGGAFRGIARCTARWRVIPVAVRRWRSALWKRSVWSEIGALRSELRGERYDAVVDTQSLVKSALICTLASGKRHGMDRASAREWLAPSFYDVRHSVPRNLHAVERNRLLTASALGYLGAVSALRPACRPASRAMSCFNHDEPRRQALAGELGRARAQPRRAAIRRGSEVERRGANAFPAVGQCYRLDEASKELARLLAGARNVVGLDTGLTHLAAALGAAVGICLRLGPGADRPIRAPLAEERWRRRPPRRRRCCRCSA
jgi:heptosyltransferase-1